MLGKGLAWLLGGVALIKLVSGPSRAPVRLMPRSDAMVEVMREAARRGGFPEWWATSEGLHDIIDDESGGWVGRPNGASPSDPAERPQLWPQVWAKARAGDVNANPWGTEYIGLGQLGPADGDWSRWREGSARFMPRGPGSLGIAVEEAIGVMGYCRDRYGDPETARAWYVLPLHPNCRYERRSDGRYVQVDPEGCRAWIDACRRAGDGDAIAGAIRLGFKYHSGW